MTILFVDHHDSFVHNLISWFKKNSREDILTLNCLEVNKVGGKKFFSKIRGVVFSPGPGHASEYKSSVNFYKGLPPHIPFLGVCLGYQIMLYAHGAELVQTSATPIHGRQIKIRKKINSLLLPENALQGYFVLYNSLGVHKGDSVFQKNFNLLVSEGQFSLAAEHVSLPHVGVQFHPESFASPAGEYFMQCFLRLLNC